MKFFYFFILVLFFQNSLAVSPPPLLLEDIPSIPGSRSVKQLKKSFDKLKFTHKENRNILWWLQFKEGEMIPDQFCENMEVLSKEEDFPLHFLAGIYFYEKCSLTEDIVFNINHFPDWLKPLAALSSYRRGKELNNKKEILNAALSLSYLSSYEELQVSYQQHARRLARELKDSRLKEIEKKLFQMAPRLNSDIQLKDYLSVANDFRKVRNFKKARYWYLKILKSSETGWGEKNQSFKWLAWIYKRQKKMQKFLKTMRGWSKWLAEGKNKKAWKLYYKNQIKVARGYWNLDQNQKALNLLNTIISEKESSVVVEEAHYLKGLIRAGEGFLEESLEDLNRALISLEEKGENISFQEKILWKKAWILRELKQPTDSIRILKKLIRKTEEPAIKARAAFWIGENQMDLKRRFSAARTFRSIRKEDPIGYYGLMASYRLNKAPLFSIRDTQIPLKKMNMNAEDIPVIHWLLSLNKKDLLKTFLKSRKESLEIKQERTMDDWLVLISLYKATERYLDIFQTFALMSPHLQKSFIEQYGGLLFPLAFQEEVEREAIRQKVSPALLFALIRQESAFNKQARSPADAFGLMQLLPSTARAMARKMRIPYRRYSDLYNAEKNISLGTAYFKNLLSKYNGSLILAAAAYNAGGTPVKKWRDFLDKTHPLSFIESIPYGETRVYVKLVIRNFIIYNKILRDLYKTGSDESSSIFSLFNIVEVPPFSPESSEEESDVEFSEEDHPSSLSVSELSNREELWQLLLKVYSAPKKNPDKLNNEIKVTDNDKEITPEEDNRFFFSRFFEWIFSSKEDLEEGKEKFSLWFPKNLFFID